MSARASKKKAREIVLERIYRLFDLAGQAFKEGKRDYARGLVAKARRLSKRNNATIPRELKYRFCKECGSLWVPGENVTIRVTNGRITYKCECGAEKKKTIKKKKGTKKTRKG